MSGNSILIDTNIALYLLDGDVDVAKILDGQEVYISIISELELLGYQGISESEKLKVKAFLDNCIIIELNQTIKDLTIQLKQAHRIKLPDAVIAATSKYLNIPLISADRGFEKIDDLQFIRYEV